MTTADVTDLMEFKQAKRRQQVGCRKLALLDDLGEPHANFFRVSHLTVRHPAYQSLSPRAQSLYIMLCAHRNRYQRGKAYFTRSLRQLAADLRWSVNTVRKNQKELINQRFIVCVSRPGGRSRYQILDVRQ